MKCLLLAVAALFVMVSVLRAEPITPLASPEFQQFAQLAQAAADKQGAQILVQYDADQRLLKVSRQFQVNQYRKMTQVQTVKIDDLTDVAEGSSVGGMQEPWLRIYCHDKKKKVQLDSTQEINGAVDDGLTNQEYLAFLLLPCQSGELQKVQDAYAVFKKSVSR
jgi:hypothetical protein